MKNIRTCIACRNKFNKLEQNLIKITKTKEGFFINKPVLGRSCYVCNNKDCINKVCKNKLLSKAFKCTVDDSIYTELINLKRY